MGHKDKGGARRGAKDDAGSHAGAMGAGAEGLALRHDAFGRLVVTLPTGAEVVDVVPVRCFPFTAPDEWIALCDERGREVTSVPHLDVLRKETRAVLVAALDELEFVPRIRAIRSVSPGAEPTTWHVETDRGPSQFVLPSEDNLRRLVGGGILIADDHGVRYLIPDLRALDSASRRILGRYL